MDPNHAPIIAATGPGPQFLNVGCGFALRAIACRIRSGTSAGKALPGLVWLAGFNSTMVSTKATFLDDFATDSGRSLIRFDYSGTGESGGRFAEGTISRWLEETLAVFHSFAQGPHILIGSSMGGWLALLLARALVDRAHLAGMVLIAPAVDFTQALMWERFSDPVKQEIVETGEWRRPSIYGDAPYPITRALIDDGRNHLLFGSPVRSHCPVHILQGMADPDVPWQHAMQLVEHLASDPVVLTLVKDGDHRLSRPQDLARLVAAIEAVEGQGAT